MVYTTLTQQQCDFYLKKTRQQLHTLKNNAHQYFEHDLQTLIDCYNKQIKQLKERKTILKQQQ